MLVLAKAAKDAKDARAMLETSVKSGAALELFGKMIEAQGGDARVVDDVGRLPRAKLSEPFVAVRDGVVADVDAMGVALAALRLGAGRKKADDRVDHAVGFSGLVKIGEHVAQGAPLCVVHANDERALEEAKEMLSKAILVGEEAEEGAIPKLVDEAIG
jgi:pyrimidine-nucleoside phosphorylase